MKIKKYICETCGSNNFKHIGFDKYICNYCGTVVEEINDNIVTLQVYPMKVKTIQAIEIITTEVKNYFSQNEIERHIMLNISRHIADELMKSGCLEIDREIDPYNLKEKYRGRIRVCVKQEAEK